MAILGRVAILDRLGVVRLAERMMPTGSRPDHDIVVSQRSFARSGSPRQQPAAGEWRDAAGWRWRWTSGSRWRV